MQTDTQGGANRYVEHDEVLQNNSNILSRLFDEIVRQLTHVAQTWPLVVIVLIATILFLLVRQWQLVAELQTIRAAQLRKKQE